jgi:hypothetical protein
MLVKHISRGSGQLRAAGLVVARRPARDSVLERRLGGAVSWLIVQMA